MTTINFNFDGDFYIERCENCLGLFFDPGEVETMLDYSVPHVCDIDHRLIDRINNDRGRIGGKVRYVKCPVCRNFMNRTNFGARSGVVI